MDTFSSASASCGIWNIQAARDDKQIHIVPEAMFLMISEAHMNIFFIVKVKILLLNDHIGPPIYVGYWA